jgi:hypothetical protein
MPDFVKFKTKNLLFRNPALVFYIAQKKNSSPIMSESRYRSSQKTANPREVACLLGPGTMIAFIFSTLSLKWPSGHFVRQSILDLTAVIKL